MTELKTLTRPVAQAEGAGACSGVGDAGRDYDGHPDDKVELLTYVLGGQDFAVDIMTVREIRGWSEPTPLVDAPAYVRGMINLRGVVLPVFDLAMRINGSVAEKDARGVIIVVESGERAAGLMVDGVTDIITLSKDELRPPPTSATSAESDMIRSLIVANDQIIQLLDLDSVLGDIT